MDVTWTLAVMVVWRLCLIAYALYLAGKGSWFLAAFIATVAIDFSFALQRELGR